MAGGGRRIRLLLADESRNMRSLIRSAFPYGIDQPEFTEVANGDEAVQAYRVQRFDIVLLDMKMQGMDGFETLTTIKNFDEDAFVVLISSQHSTDAMTRALNAGAASVAHKPVSQRVARDILDAYRARTRRPAAVLAADGSSDIVAALAAGLGILKIEHRIYQTETPSETLRAFEKLHFDMVFIDSVLSGEPTLKLVNYIKTNRPLTYLVMFTDDSTEDSVLRARRQGADDYLLKSVDLIQLTKVWNRFLATSKAELSTGRRPLPAFE